MIAPEGELAPSSPAAAPAPRSRLWRGIGVYLALAFGLSWAAQIAVSLIALSGGGGTAGAIVGNVFMVALLLMWPPAVGAFVARRFVEGGSFADSGLRRGPWRYIVIAWFLPAAIVFLSLLLSLPIAPFDPSFTTLREVLAQQGAPAETPVAALIVGQIVQALLLAPLINGVFAFGEEFGWRAYLLPRLMQAWGPWPGLLAHGAIWGFWHAPLIALTGYNYPQHHYLGVALFVVTCTLLGTIFGWLRLASDSVLPPTIAHGAFNGIAAVPAFLLVPGFDTAFAGSAISVVGWVVMALVILVLWQTGTLPRALARGCVPGEPGCRVGGLLDS